MMVLTGPAPIHARARDILDHLPEDALVVVNDSGVVPARVVTRRLDDGRPFELLVTDPDPSWRPGATVRAWVRHAKKLRPGAVLELPPGASDGPSAGCRLEYVGPDDTDPRARRFELLSGDLFATLVEGGQIPLPPYIRRPDGPTEADRQRYQTVYARAPGSVAAPTAGLHLEPELVSELERRHRLCRVTLHVGPGTFLPMEHDDVRDHRVGAERIEIDEVAASRLTRARAEGRDVVAVGTTCVRTLESVAQAQAKRRGLSVWPSREPIEPYVGATDLIITPAHRFAVVDRLLTNFHLPRSSLLMLTASFGGRSRVLGAYATAVATGYRFYSYGDCMLLTRAEAAQLA